MIRASLLVAVLLMLAAPSLAAAAQRFAATADLGAGNCSTAANACDLDQAIGMTGVGDEVILAPGNYIRAVGTGLSVAATMRGTAGQPRPKIISSALQAVTLTGGATLRDIEINHIGTGIGSAGLLLTSSATPSLVERVFVRSEGLAACGIENNPGTLRDSVCWNPKSGGLRVALFATQSVSGSLVATARNVTTVAPFGQAVLAYADAFGESVTLNLTNAIADSVQDVTAEAHSAAIATVNIDHSNHSGTFEVGIGSGGVPNVNEGVGNQGAAPLFTDAANGNFHQLTGSPTIDNGIGGAGLGSADLDGEARTQGALPDIGADEFTPVAAATPATPAAGAAKGCKKKKRKKRAASPAKKCKKKKKKKR